jgi:hypothetical protein
MNSIAWLNRIWIFDQCIDDYITKINDNNFINILKQILIYILSKLLHICINK